MFFTNLLSAESFISTIDANSLSMEETEFEKNMEFARAFLAGLSTDLGGLPSQSYENVGNNSKAEPVESRYQAFKSKRERDSSITSKSSDTISTNKVTEHAKDEPSMPKILSLSDIENRGATMLLKEDPASPVFREYPYLFAHVGDLTINDVEDLLNDYKKLVFKCVCLSKGLGDASTSFSVTNSQTYLLLDAEPLNKHHDTGAAEPNDEAQKHAGIVDEAGTVPFVSEENVIKNLWDAAKAPKEERKDETPQ